MPRIKISPVEPAAGNVRQSGQTDGLLKFSFKLFDHVDEHMCPARFPEGYTQTLMQRMRDLSSWKVSEFTGPPKKTVRNHRHDWQRTARPDGFAHLNEQLRAYEGWQFCLTANAHGRVHGIIIDDTFYVIWLDSEHALYP